MTIRFGFFGAGLAACVGWFCLQPLSLLSQSASVSGDPKPISEADASEASSGSPTSRQLEEQHQRTLRAIERASSSSEAAFKQSLDAMSDQVNLLRRTISLERNREMEALGRSNRNFFLVLLGLVLLALLATSLTAFLQVRALHRLTRMARSYAAPVPAGYSVLASANAIIASKAREQTGLLLAIERLDRRLDELETVTTRRAIARETAELSQKNAANVAAPAAKTPVSRPPAKFPHIALTIGENAALGFLPEEQRRNAYRPPRSFFAQFKKLFHFPGAKKTS